jgi:hypothetical protein
VSFARQRTVVLVLLRSARHRTCAAGLDHLLNGTRTVCFTTENQRPPRFLGNPHVYHALLLDPAEWLASGTTTRALLPSTLKTVSASERDTFRGSITRPSHPLCTLRSQGHPCTTQHSVPAGCQPLPGRLRFAGQASDLLGSFRSFQPNLPLHDLPLLQASPGALSTVSANFADNAKGHGITNLLRCAKQGGGLPADRRTGRHQTHSRLSIASPYTTATEPCVDCLKQSRRRSATSVTRPLLYARENHSRPAHVRCPDQPEACVARAMVSFAVKSCDGTITRSGNRCLSCRTLA